MSEEALTPLARKLRERILLAGPISVAEYMAACLGDPEHGYYMRRDPFGAAVDFVTAPEISQVFGELIGLWAVAVFEAMGAPSRFVLAELGPGRGTLIMDALRAARIRPAFAAAATIVLVETSPRLRSLQEATLAGSGVAPVFVDRVDDLPAGPAIVLANEFFDALPIRQLVSTGKGWAERMIGLDDSGRLAFGLRDVVETPSVPSRRAAARRWGEDRAEQDTLATGAILELRPAADAIMTTIAARLVRDGGAFLIIDYGHAISGFGDTLQALHRHAYDDPLAHPGEADLTAHVDFGALARAATAAGAAASPIVGQGEFLSRLGIDERARRLAAGKPAAKAAAIAAAAERLTAPDQMGSLFKVMAVAPPNLTPPGWEA